MIRERVFFDRRRNPLSETVFGSSNRSATMATSSSRRRIVTIRLLIDSTQFQVVVGRRRSGPTCLEQWVLGEEIMRTILAASAIFVAVLFGWLNAGGNSQDKSPQAAKGTPLQITTPDRVESRIGPLTFTDGIRPRTRLRRSMAVSNRGVDTFLSAPRSRRRTARRSSLWSEASG